MRKLGMRASPDLLTIWTLPGRATSVMIVVGALAAAAYLSMPEAKGQPGYCTPAFPIAPNGGVCTNLNAPSWCDWGTNCSPVPGTPGTWNPNGYTPRCDSIYCTPAERQFGPGS